jgi:hypothetical protein
LKEECLLFLDQLKKKQHIHFLLKHKQFLIGFNTKEELVYLLFENGMAQCFEQIPKNTEPIIIEGKKEAITSLLKGDIKLRKAILHNQLAVKAPFRTLLTLEAIFTLSKPYAENIS